MREALLTRVLAQHRLWLIQQEAAAMRKADRDTAAARVIFNQRLAAVGASAAFADALAAVGERQWTLRQLDAYLSDLREYRQLQLAATRYGDRYAQAAVDAIDAARAELIVRAQRVGLATTVLQLPDASAARLAGSLQLVPVDKVSRLAGLGANASPLRSLQTLSERSSLRVLDAMIRGAARGDNPLRVTQQIARTLTDATRADVLRVTRTEMLRASRAGTTAWTDANAEYLDGWIWYAELDDATCASCWAMHGELQDSGEIMGTHPNCRCAQLPRPKSPAELGFAGIADDRPEIESGADRFAQLTPEERLRILGPAKAEAYENGQIRLGDVVKVREDPVWGTTRSVGSLEHALG